MAKYYLKAVLTDLGATPHTLAGELASCVVQLTDRGADTAALKILNLNNAYGATYVNGCKVEIYVDQNDPPTTKVFTGLIEENEFQIPSRKREYLILSANNLYSVQAMNKLIYERYLDDELSVIEKDVVDDLVGVTTTNVQTSAYTIDDIPFVYKFSSECLDRLAEIGYRSWRFDSVGDLHTHEKGAVSSGLSIGDSDVMNIPSFKRSIKELKNRVFIIGGIDAGGNRIVALAEDFDSITTYIYPREIVIKEPSLSTHLVARQFADGVLQKLKAEGKSLSIVTKPLASLPIPGQTLAVDVTSIGVDETMLLKSVDVNFSRYKGVHSFGMELVSL